MINGKTKIKFEGERCRYTVMASSDKYVILTKPFNAQKTYLYTIVDLENKIRGKCDLIFGIPTDVNTLEGAKEALIMLESGRMGVSKRYSNHVKLKETEIDALLGIN